jgi:hypothetical protein
LRSSWGTPRVTRRDAAGVFLATPFHAGFDDLDDNCKIDSLLSMLADAKLQKEIEVRQLRTRSTNEREQKKAELNGLTRLLSEAQTSRRVSRDRHDVLTSKLDNVTLEMMKVQKQVKELQKQLEQNGTSSLMMHCIKIRKGRGKWGNMALKLFNVKQLKGYFLKKSSRYIRENIHTARTICRIIDFNHAINLSGIDALRTAEAACSTHQTLLWSSETIKACYREIEKNMSCEIPMTEVK